MTNLISIIIPVFNREHLIAETLDSIISQSYANWECLIVDDGSTDNTLQLLEAYNKKDSRILCYSRDNSKPKGANACRNIGLQKAKGDYVVFFDSDDLMTPNHLEIKINALKNNTLDFVITRTKYFNYDSTQIDKYYKFDEYKITPQNYITQKINWLTYDVCLKTNIAKTITFNENLQSGQEYNYFSKLVLKTVNAIFIDEVVTLRRHHDDSIRTSLKDSSKLNLSRFKSFWLTYLDIKNEANINSKRFMLKFCIDMIYRERKILTKFKMQFIFETIKVFKAKSVYFLLMLFSMFCFGKGFYFRQKLLNYNA